MIEPGRADAAVIDAVNAVLEGAVVSWGLTERGHRLAVPCLRFRGEDARHVGFVTLDVGDLRPGAFAAWESIAAGAPDGGRTAVLHGLFVLPALQGRGVGTKTLKLAEETLGEHGFNRVGLRAWRDSAPFFLGRGYRPTPGGDGAGLAPMRLCKVLT